MSFDPAGKAKSAVAAARENIQLIQAWAAGRDLEDLKADIRTRYAIERAFMAIDASIRDIPAELLAAHGIPAAMIAGFRNALAHTYDDILDERVVLTIQEDLPMLDTALAGLRDAL